MRCTTCGGTGAPALVTRRILGRDSPYSASTRIKAGEPNNWVTPNRVIALCSLRGLALAGRVGSMSGMMLVRPNAGSNKANGGKVGRSMPPASIPNALPSISICAMKCRCRYTTPLGTPVLPLVNRIAATSSPPVAANCGPAPAPSTSTCAKVASAHHALRPVVIRTCAELAQPNSFLANIAKGMPINACGCASSKHCFNARLAIPGSTNTGTAPRLNSANISRKNSGVGRTITTTRLPRTMPRLPSPAAMASLRASSWA